MQDQRLTTYPPWILLSALWTVMIISLLIIGINEQQSQVSRHAEILADASYQKDILYRRWSSSHGGTYVPITKETQPNPYLKHLKDRDIETTTGLRLTLINPTYMTRQAYELGRQQSGIQSHITSLNPLRPENLADPWEAKGLKVLADKQAEKYLEQLDIDGEPYLRAIYPLKTEAPCLKCHLQQGYRVGDVRGGISVSVPLIPYLQGYQQARNVNIVVLLIVWILGLGLLTWLFGIIRKQFVRLESSRQQATLAEDRYRDIFDGAEHGIAIVNADSKKIVDCNQKLTDLLGSSKQQLIGATAETLPGSRDLKTTLSGRELELPDPAGQVSHILVKKRLITLAGQQTEEFLFYDHTLEKQGEKKVLATAQRIRDIFQAAQNIAFVIAASTEDAPIIEFSPGAEKIFGYRKEEIIGKPVSLLHAPDTDIPDLQERMTTREVAFSGRIELIRKSGQIFPALFTLYPLFDEHDMLYGGLGVSIDISDLKELEERLNQTQKMEAIGTLAGGIAHDFNNILSIIFGYTQLAARHIDHDSKAFKHLQTIEDAATRAKELVKQILTFSRKSSERKQPLSLQPIIKEGLKMLKATLPKTILVEEEFSQENDQVIADPTQMHQVLMNICTNAYHAMRQTGGTLKVCLKNATIDKLQADRFPELAAGPYVVLQISDTGTGIDEEVLPKIFDPFFTTKLTQDGTGMGLSVVHGIINNHGGAIRVETAANSGSCFSIYLPQADKPSIAATQASNARSSGNERILLVDDEPLLAALGKDLLTALGYSVKVATDGRKALEIFKATPQQFDLVVTDQTMPFLTGAELCRQLVAIRPDLPVIICTGFSELVNKNNYREFGAAELLNKPLDKNQLGRAIREILG